jgi:hypothetical protein
VRWVADGAHTLAEIEVGSPGGAWESLGFAVEEGSVALGFARVRPTGAGGGMLGWTIAGLKSDQLDGLPTTVPPVAPMPPPVPRHPNGARRIDHVVARTPRFDSTVAALLDAGLELRRVRDATPEIRQGFLWVGDVILELVEDRSAEAPMLWGLVVVVDDIAALADRLGDRIGPPKQAIQPGRQIAVVRDDAAPGVPLAFMTPHVKRAAA